MKKIIALFFALMLVLSLVACGGKSGGSSKYVGTYHSGGLIPVPVVETRSDGTQHYKIEYVGSSSTMILRSDGTGVETIEPEALPSQYTNLDPDGLKTACKFDITWREEGDYLVITFSGYSNIAEGVSVPYIDDWLSQPRKVSYTKSYELKGTSLMNVKLNSDSYTKVN